jgi:hypothetical protein
VTLCGGKSVERPHLVRPEIGPRPHVALPDAGIGGRKRHMKPHSVFLCGLLRRFSRGNILAENDESTYVVMSEKPGSNLPAQPLQRAVGAPEGLLVGADRLAVPRASMDFLPAVGNIAKNFIVRLTGDIARQVKIVAPAGAGREIAHVPIEHGHGRRRLLDELLQLRFALPRQSLVG